MRPPGQYRSSLLQMELRTTKQEDFRPFAYTEPTNVPSAGQVSLGVKFTGKSAYEMAYPNWGPYEVIHMKHFNVPHNMDSLKLDTKTTYSETYKPDFDSSYSSPKTAQDLKRSYMRGSPLSGSTNFYGETTAKKYFFDPREAHIKTESMKAKEWLTQTDVPESHFKSLYQMDFEQTQVRPRQLKPKRLA
jgi:hypothetical protein